MNTNTETSKAWMNRRRPVLIPLHLKIVNRSSRLETLIRVRGKVSVVQWIPANRSCIQFIPWLYRVPDWYTHLASVSTVRAASGILSSSPDSTISSRRSRINEWNSFVFLTFVSTTDRVSIQQQSSPSSSRVSRLPVTHSFMNVCYQRTDEQLNEMMRGDEMRWDGNRKNEMTHDTYRRRSWRGRDLWFMCRRGRWWLSQRTTVIAEQ